MKKLVSASTLLLAITIIVSSFIAKPKHPVRNASGKESHKLAAKWALDKVHSNVKFTVTHMVVSEVDGYFKTFDGTIEGTKADFSDAVITFTVDVASINTDNENRDKHLKSNDFFNAEQFPQMKFVSTSFKPVADNKYKLEGDLTIRDITKPVIFDVTYGGSINTQRGAKIGFKANAIIDRFDYNLKWDRATEAGSLVVAKEVAIKINAQFNEVK